MEPKKPMHSSLTLPSDQPKSIYYTYQKIYKGVCVALLSMQRSFKVDPLLMIFSMLPRICETASARTGKRINYDEASLSTA